MGKLAVTPHHRWPTGGARKARVDLVIDIKPTLKEVAIDLDKAEPVIAMAGIA